MLTGTVDLPVLPVRDRLGVLTSTWPVVQVADAVRLDGDRVAQVADDWAATPWPPAEWDAALHWTRRDLPERQLNWLLLLDGLNFCFWPTTPEEPRWQVAWHGQIYNGYNALAAALSRAVEEQKPLWDATYLAQMDDVEMTEIMRGVPDDQGRATQIPLMPERVMHAREIGEVLVRHDDGQFARMVEAARGDAVGLALAVARDFPSFRDLALWEGQEVFFYKRAQILVADIAGAFADQGPGHFVNIGELTAFADYKVPQLLQRLGILDYTPELAEHIDRYEPILPGSAAEIAIRAATIWGVEWLRQALASRGVTVTPAQIDLRLWLAGQAVHRDDRPYHRTRTIFY